MTKGKVVCHPPPEQRRLGYLPLLSIGVPSIELLFSESRRRLSRVHWYPKFIKYDVFGSLNPSGCDGYFYKTESHYLL